MDRWKNKVIFTTHPRIDSRLDFFVLIFASEHSCLLSLSWKNFFLTGTTIEPNFFLNEFLLIYQLWALSLNVFECGHFSLFVMRITDLFIKWPIVSNQTRPPTNSARPTYGPPPDQTRGCAVSFIQILLWNQSLLKLEEEVLGPDICHKLQAQAQFTHFWPTWLSWLV